MSVLLEAIETTLVSQLTVAFTKPGDARPWLKVEGWPTRPEGYRLTGVGDVLVIYKGARYHAKGPDPKFYETRLEYEIALRARTLRDHTGAYAMLDTARRAVCGQRIDQAAGTTLAVRDDFIDYGEGVFAYALVIEVPVLIVQDACGASGPWLDLGCCDGPPLSRVNYVPGDASLLDEEPDAGEHDV